MKRGILFILTMYIFCFTSVNASDDIDLLELDSKFYSYLKSIFANNGEGVSEDMILTGEIAVEELKQYKDIYDNYNYFLGQYYLYIAHAYTFINSNGLNGYSVSNNYEPDLEKEKNYFEMYKQYKDSTFHRATQFMVEVDSLDAQFMNNTENKLFSIYKNKIYNKNDNIKLNFIFNINKLLYNQKSDEVNYTLNYLKYLTQNDLYTSISDSYQSKDYQTAIDKANSYIKAFDFIFLYDENHTSNITIQKYFNNFRFEKIKNLLYASYYDLLNSLNNDNMIIKIGEEALNSLEYSFEKNQIYKDYFHYIAVISCPLSNAYKNIGEKDKYISSSKECFNSYKIIPRGGGLLLQE